MKYDPLHQSKRCGEDLYNYLSSLSAFQDLKHKKKGKEKERTEKEMKCQERKRNKKKL
jgi:hypothetical protein